MLLLDTKAHTKLCPLITQGLMDTKPCIKGRANLLEAGFWNGSSRYRFQTNLHHTQSI